MALAFGLLLLAVITAIATALAGGMGVWAVVIVTLLGALAMGMHSSEHAMAMGFIGAFALPFILGAGALGAWSGALLRKQRYRWAALPLLPVAFFAWTAWHGDSADKEEQALISDLLHGNPQLAQMAGEGVRPTLSSRTTYSASGRGRYEYALRGKKLMYAIVAVDRPFFGKPNVTLECVTTVAIGNRTGGNANACNEGVVPLGDTRYALDKPAAAAAAPAQPIPQMAPAPRDAELHVIAVYEAKNRSRSAPSSHEPGDIRVVIEASSKPLLLYLNSYEPVRWAIENKGRPIAAVMTSGYHPSTVTGTDASVVSTGRRDTLYNARTAELEELRTRMRAHTTGPFKTQQSYAGVEFTVPAP